MNKIQIQMIKYLVWCLLAVVCWLTSEERIFLFGIVHGIFIAWTANELFLKERIK